MAEALTPRRVGRQPGPEDTVWLFNEVLEQQPDESWIGWIEPLDRSRSDRVMEVRADTPTEIREQWIIQWCLIVQDQGKAAWDEFLRDHAKPFVNSSIPPIGWPPKSGRYRKLGFLPEYAEG